MEIRVLKYFLTVAREQNITRAAEVLHLTQPTLSRQLAALEEELGTPLLVRGGKKITLTEEGVLLKRRALEILELTEKTEEEIRARDRLIEGAVSIGCGEYGAVETLAKICAAYREKYPKVQIRLHTENATAVLDLMRQGLADVGIFMEPFDTDGFDYIRLPGTDPYGAVMRPDDPLAAKEFITREDLVNRPLGMAERINVQSELAHWFGPDFEKLDVAFTSNLATNSHVMTQNGLAIALTTESTLRFRDPSLLVFRPLSPALRVHTLIAWRRNIPVSIAVQKFIDEINAFGALNNPE